MTLVKLQKKISHKTENGKEVGVVLLISVRDWADPFVCGQTQKTFLREMELFISSLSPLDGQEIQDKTKFRVIK